MGHFHNAHKVGRFLNDRLRGKLHYESTTYGIERPYFSCYTYLKKINKKVRISDHAYHSGNRKFDIDVILSLSSLDISVNGFPIPLLPNDDKHSMMVKLSEHLKENFSS
jgi:hypothetical protein